MQQAANYTLEFQIAKKLTTNQNHSGVRLRKLRTDLAGDIHAEATILAKNTMEYEPVRQSLQTNENYIQCKGVGKSLKIIAGGANANLRLLEFLETVENLEPEAKHCVDATLAFMGADENALSNKISMILGSRCDVVLKSMNMEKDLLLLDCEAQIDEKIGKSDFFDALSEIEINDEFGIIK